jgi:hypothetical protein
VEPDGHAYPAGHEPEQVELVKPDVAPYCPLGQLLQLESPPPKEYCPGLHDWHVEAAVAPEVPLYVPAGQRVQEPEALVLE